MPRRAPAILALMIALAAIVGDVRPAAARPEDAEEAQALLTTIAGAGAKDARQAAVTRLIELGPHIVEPLTAFLSRKHATTPEQRRPVLKAIKASVPDKKGKFESPGREKKDKIRADDEFDWLAALVELDQSTPAYREVVADVAAIRALAASRKIEAGRAILAAGFAADTMVYRDDCGRQLRKMTPYSLPALIAGSQGKKSGGRERYSNYQLERVDRQDPGKAVNAAEDDEDLLIAVLAAFGATEHREAVGVVFSMINEDAPRVRQAARTAWLAYVTGPAPASAPRKHLNLPGGIKAAKATKMWLNSRELAQVELTRTTEELFGEVLAEDADLESATLKIFTHHDGERAGRDTIVLNEGKAKAEGGDLAGAIAIFDRLLAQDPGRADRVQMTATYQAHADALAETEQWAEASVMYAKAHGVEPEGEGATEALAAHYFTLGKSLEAEDKDGSAAFRRAIELRPDYAEAEQAARAAAPPAKKPASKAWMLYAAGGVAGGALLLLMLGLRRRR